MEEIFRKKKKVKILISVDNEINEILKENKINKSALINYLITEYFKKNKYLYKKQK